VDQTRFINNKETERNKYKLMQQEQTAATDLPIINFEELTINYDEEYIDETLKPLYEEVDSDY
jgi:hypothetical protein